MNELQKQLLKIEERIDYLTQIKASSEWGNLEGFKRNCNDLKQSIYDYSETELSNSIRKLDDSIRFLEDRAE